jgi:choline dehydrogenase
MDNIHSTYHYIIIGAGASGCVIANRLSANPAIKVLVLEAGDMDTNPDIADVGGFVKLWGSDNDWKLHTTPQSALLNREIVINQGKVLGGSSSINAMMYVRGNPANYNQWSALGAEGWSYKDVLPYFKCIENYNGEFAEYHGVDGELTIRDCPEDKMRSPEFLNAAAEAGYNGGPHWDYNAAKQENGAGLLQFHIDANGKRESGATAFLHPVMDRSNLTVLTGAHVTKIVIENDTARGVEFIKDNKTQICNVINEVILSAGALASPKILLLSGIGPSADLQQVGIDVKVNLPGVGKNLQDHLQLPIIFRTTENLPHTTLLTGNVLFIKTNSDRVAPDMQINFTPSIPAPLAPLLPDFGGPVCIFLAILVQPQSTGELKLASNNPLDAPVINPGYLQNEEDIKALTTAVKVIRSIAGTEAFTKLNAGELAPGEADMDGFIRSQVSTLWHPAGTCRMGTDAMAVVDPKLKVRGIKKLRVADASVMPVVTSGNTVAACFMIGERASQMIKNDN